MVTSSYKQTGFRIVPIDWDIARIDQLASITTGSRNTQDRVEDGSYPFFVRSQQVEKVNTFSYDGEAVLTVGDGVGTGKVFHYINGRFDIHQRVYRISEFSERLNGRYFFYQFSSRFYRRIMSMTAKSSVDSVRMEMIAGMKVPVPPLDEQRAIASALSDVDALLEGLDQLISKKCNLKQAAMQQLLTGQTRLPGFHGEWKVKRLGEFASIRNQKVLPSSVGADTLCVELDHIAQGNGRLLEHSTAQNSTSSKYRFFVGDVLFGRLRSYLRKFWHADQDGICSTEIWPLMIDARQAEGGFLHAIVQSDRFVDAASLAYGTHMPRADWGVIRNFEVHLPKLSEQRAIATILSDMDAEISALEVQRDKTHDLKQAMMQELLTGKTRLVKPEAAHA